MDPVDTTAIHAEILRYLEIVRDRLGLPPERMRVLDYGCGDGEGVLALRRLGYQAFGAERWAEGLERARARLTAAGFAGAEVFSFVDDNGATAFADGQFHFIVSQEVFEHVADLDVVAGELSRVTAPGGFGLHIYPPRRRVQEPHFFMPFVHWLPKNRLRHAAILGYCLVGLGGRPPQIPGAGPLKRASYLYHYSIEETFYRPHGKVAGSLHRAKLDTCFVVTNHRKVRAHGLLARVANAPLLRPVMDWTLLTFMGVNLFVRKPSGKDCADRLTLGGWSGTWRRASPGESVEPRQQVARAASRQTLTG